jgi:hypothetical protein
MKTYGGVDIWNHIFLTLALVLEVSGQLHAPAALPPPPGERPLVPIL